jgi:exonuclease VII large subunit
MNEKTLVVVCILASVIGIAIMMLSNILFQPKTTMISDIEEKMNFVLTEGFIINIRTSKSGTSFIRVEDSSGILNVVVFKNSIKGIDNLKENDKIMVQGKPEIYEGSLELIATKITKSLP